MLGTAPIFEKKNIQASPLPLYYFVSASVLLRLRYYTEIETVTWDEERSSEAPVLLVNEPKMIKSQVRAAQGARRVVKTH